LILCLMLCVCVCVSVENEISTTVDWSSTKSVSRTFYNTSLISQYTLLWTPFKWHSYYSLFIFNSSFVIVFSFKMKSTEVWNNFVNLYCWKCQENDIETNASPPVKKKKRETEERALKNFVYWVNCIVKFQVLYTVVLFIFIDNMY
jgi:hypothetical protein